MKRLFNLTCMLLVLPLMMAANNGIGKYKYEKTKTIKKEFSVNADALLEIKNKYGNVDVVSWDENRIVIVVTITTSGNDEDKVTDKLDDITVNFDASSNHVSAETRIESSGFSWFSWGRSNVNYKIDYTVKMPVTNNTNIVNDYGSISLNELKGDAKINCDYGKITIGNLYSSNNSINIDYTNNSTVNYMKRGSINADYSGFTVESAGTVDLNADYTKSVFEQINTLNYNCDYGSLTVESGNEVIGSGDYLSIKLGTIKKTVKISADYGSVKIARLSDGFNTVSINSNYTGVRVGTPTAAPFDFEIQLSYSSFKYDSNLEFQKQIEKSSSKYYEGYFKSQHSGSTIKITSDYGGVTFN